MRACVRVRACVNVCVFIYFMMTCACQIHDVSVNDTFPVDNLVTGHYDKKRLKTL